MAAQASDHWAKKVQTRPPDDRLAGGGTLTCLSLDDRFHFHRLLPLLLLDRPHAFDRWRRGWGGRRRPQPLFAFRHSPYVSHSWERARRCRLDAWGFFGEDRSVIGRKDGGARSRGDARDRCEKGGPNVSQGWVMMILRWSAHGSLLTARVYVAWACVWVGAYFVEGSSCRSSGWLTRFSLSQRRAAGGGGRRRTGQSGIAFPALARRVERGAGAASSIPLAISTARHVPPNAGPIAQDIDSASESRSRSRSLSQAFQSGFDEHPIPPPEQKANDGGNGRCSDVRRWSAVLCSSDKASMTTLIVEEDDRMPTGGIEQREELQCRTIAQSQLARQGSMHR